MQRLLALAAVALLAGLVAIAVVEQRADEPVSAPTGGRGGRRGWYEALAAPRPPGEDAERTTCGLILTAARSVSRIRCPCGAKLLIRYGGETVLTDVIDNELVATGRSSSSRPRSPASSGWTARRRSRALREPPVTTSVAPTTLRASATLRVTSGSQREPTITRREPGSG